MSLAQSGATVSERSDETLERNETAQIARLQRAIVKLAFSFHSHIPALGDRLKRLGGLLKSGPRSAAVYTLIDDIIEQIVSADLRRSDAGYAAQQLSELLLQLDFGAEDDAEQRAISRRLTETTEPSDFTRLAQEAANAINRQLKSRSAGLDLESAQAPSNEPLLRLFELIRCEGELKDTLSSLRERVEKARSVRAALDAAEESAILISRGLQEYGTTTSDNASNKAIELGKQTLLKLIEKIASSGFDNEDITASRKAIASAATQDDYTHAALVLGDVLVKARIAQEQELDELGGFLKAVSRRLEEFKTNLRQSGYTHDDSITDALQMQQTLEGQMVRLRHGVTQEIDLGHLKSFVSEELDELGSALTTYIDTSTSRHNTARQHVSVALQRLNDIETEMNQLKADLNEQHKRNLIDPLTGAFNRSGYTDGIAREFSRWRRHD
ncbi:MAG: hypothetical protein ACREPG_09160, partial [Candidatus Binatia bacterium]